MTPLFRSALVFLLMAATAPVALAQDAANTVNQWMQQHHGQYGLTKLDATSWTITSSSTDKRGITYVYIRQEANGLPVEGAVANFAVKDGRVVNFGNRLQADVSGRAGSTAPGMRAEDALRAAARQLGLVPTDVKVEKRVSRTEVVLSGSGISSEPVPAKLVYQPAGKKAIPLAWDLVIRERGGQHWWHVAVDAQSGELLRKNDWIVQCDMPVVNARAGSPTAGYSAAEDLAMMPAVPAAAPPPPPDGASYLVFPFPTESPVYGGQTLVTDPADAVASPNGWHDTDGDPGAEYTITRGNNVYAGEDRNNDDVIGFSPDGGSGLNFNFPYTPPQEPSDYLGAAITNLFYTCNMLHDVWYHYGFDEEGGNFQEMNYTGSGQGNDAVYAQAQDGGGTNNANFGTPPDGAPGAMQMYLWGTSQGDTLRVNSPSSIAGEYDIMTAGFGPPLPTSPITGDLVLVQDDVAPASDGCDVILNGAVLAGKIAVVDRGICTFVSKVQALQAEGALAVIVVNNTPGGAITMGGTDPGDVTVPSVMVSMADGQTLKNALPNGPVNATLKGAGMQMFRDCDFDNGIIAHEYGHGISNRLTGGPDNTDCLWNDEQMGEGWSDWMGMVLTMQPGDTPGQARGVGNFVNGEGPGGTGIRPAPYSTDMAVNPYTYGITNTFAFQESHALGFVWATILWDVNWALINEEGFDPDLYTGTGGNNIAMQLVIDGLKLQPCGPGFVDGRNAILLADSLDYGAEHACVIWNAFARRGLGYSASQGDANSVNDQLEAFDVPMACTTVGIGSLEKGPEGFVIAPGPDAGRMRLLLTIASRTDATVRLIGMDGRMLRELRMPKGTTMFPLDMNGMAHGAYVVELAPDNDRPERRKFVY